MIKLDYSTVSEFNELQESKVYNYLCDLLDETKCSLINADKEETIRILQGKAQQLNDIINIILTAKERMLDLRTGTKRTNIF